MPQTVFVERSPITSRLKLGIPPDGSTQVTIAVYKPDGSQLGAPSIAGPTGPTNTDEWTAQWWATQTGLDGAAGYPGDWVAVWDVNGTGASTRAKVYNVVPLPGASDDRPAWTPFLSEVADYVPRLTVDVVTPGSAIEYGTFNGNTNPTDEQAMRLVDAAAAVIRAKLGDVPQAVQGLARSVVAARAAASILRAYPRSTNPTADLQAADAMDRRTDADMAVLVAADAEAAGESGAAQALLPVWTMPAPVPWGDSIL